MFRNHAGQVSQVAFGFDYFYQCRVELLGTKGKLQQTGLTAPPNLEPVLLLETQGHTKKYKSKLTKPLSICGIYSLPPSRLRNTANLGNCFLTKRG